MKILQATHRYPPRTGGVETHVSEIATRLADRGHEVEVFSADAGRDVDSDAVVEGVRVRRFRSLAPGGAVHVAPQIALAVRRSNADVVHAHNYHSLPLAMAALGVRDVRFVVTLHYHGESASGLRDRLLSAYRPLGRWALGRADAVIAVSEWERGRLRTDFGVDATVIPNGIDVKRFAAAEPERRNRPYLLSVGRLEAYKGVQHVIRALEEVPEYDLVVAGTGPFRDDLEGIAREAGVDDRVDFLGYVDDDRLPGLYAGAAAYVTLSEFEAYGMTVGEALAAGTPCVTTTHGGLGGWSDQEGVVTVETATTAAIGAAVERAIGRPVAPTDLPGWGDVVDAVETCYQAPTGN
ncbi:glycosyltransferase family 4 protein [Halococcoides cellulosivorans]|uniref:Glycosyltransferase family 1 protein n=1 Tax=Halococcoides cellulosivorans TaxID=1679096 RepID=A0A2R4WXZ4_9EURY|nr:glycosyltransferase family 4 protein [Halococcoides cellulosivorans]AWB26415.1 glycosyltransferase family 1 protein [Halococcoides cellulosivorans]